jgi:hypothetical protein
LYVFAFFVVLSLFAQKWGSMTRCRD